MGKPITQRISVFENAVLNKNTERLHVELKNVGKIFFERSSLSLEHRENLLRTTGSEFHVMAVRSEGLLACRPIARERGDVSGTQPCQCECGWSLVDSDTGVKQCARISRAFAWPRVRPAARERDTRLPMRRRPSQGKGGAGAVSSFLRQAATEMRRCQVSGNAPIALVCVSSGSNGNFFFAVARLESQYKLLVASFNAEDAWNARSWRRGVSRHTSLLSPFPVSVAPPLGATQGAVRREVF